MGVFTVRYLKDVTLDTRFVIVGEGIERDISSNMTSRTIPAKTESLSICGACLKTNVVQADGLHICSSISGLDKNKLKIELDLPSSSKPLRILGEVRWYDLSPENDDFLYHVDILFKELSEEDREVLKKFIEEERKYIKTSGGFIRKFKLFSEGRLFDLFRFAIF